jgi:hypothetical protein
MPDENALNESIARVQEFIRQYKLSKTFHPNEMWALCTDPDADPALLRIDDLERIIDCCYKPLDLGLPLG